MNAEQVQAVIAWLKGEFSGLHVEHDLDQLNVAKFKVGDGRRTRFWLRVTHEFFTTYQSNHEIHEQLTARQTGRALREHEGHWVQLPREGPPTLWSPS